MNDSPNPETPPANRGTAPQNFAELLSFALSQGVPRADLPTKVPTFDRLVRLDGNHNFRDAGGYDGAEGREMRRHMVFRSDHLADLTDMDRRRVSELGLRIVHDFRLLSERLRQPSQLAMPADSPFVVLLATSDALGLDATVVDVIRDIIAGVRPLPAATFWEDHYLEMIEVGQPMLVGFLRSIAAPGRLPSLHHCTGGKDRTGISTALLHRLLGVSDADIMDDFLLTNLYRTPLRVEALRADMAKRGIDVEKAIPILGVTREPLLKVLRHWDANGGAEAYALDGGATTAELAYLRATLLA